ncbi:uncharacterized protein LOC113239851 [Hyposmocoma kahamanoa]|uniref:uncharacterized protein LOC113239851 n=1 Tax=Hyposmocoma kahamanoa TaxID=1477025 RepID=UPI000E6D7EB6|nr:uncharacterized protein LOC113239851 [Hyposmocoma kahamanoa]
MELNNELEDNKKCFKIREQLIDNLHITYNESTSMFVFFNKYQIFVYENLQFHNVARIFVPEFQVRQIIVSNNYLLCLDYSGNVHVISLKFKNAAQKRFKSAFQPREQNVLHWQQYDSDNIICLKLESEAYSLCLHEIGPDFQSKTKAALRQNKNHWPPQSEGKYLLCCHQIKKEDFRFIVETLQSPVDTFRDHQLIIISFDKLNVYGCLFSSKTTDTEIELVRLYSSPSEICDIKILATINFVNIVIGLTIGTIVRLSWKYDSNESEIIHLNTALSKFLPLKSNNTLIYTDGLSLWKSENTLSRGQLQFEQFFTKNVKDFVKFRDHIICTTYSNMIYIFPIEHKISVIKPAGDDEYCSAEKLFNNLDSIDQLVKETRRSDDLLKKIHNETNYITILTFSKRQDVMENVIHQNIIVYNNYNNAKAENLDVILTEEMHEYFKTDILILIKIKVQTEQKTLHQVLSSIFTNLKVHITIISKNKVVKTTSVKLTEPLKKLHILIPIDTKHITGITQLNIHTKIVSSIPGVRDEKQYLWSVICSKHAILHSEHFIKSPIEYNNSISLKEPEESLENLIIKVANMQHGEVFRFIDISTLTNPKNYTMYVKLPYNYREAMKCQEFYKKRFSYDKAKYLFHQFSADSFLRGRNCLFFEIGEEKVEFEIVNDISYSVLNVSSNNIHVAFTMRNFAASLVYNEFRNFSSGTEFVSNVLYTTTENLHKAIKDAITSNSPAQLMPLTEQFQKNVIGALPF